MLNTCKNNNNSDSRVQSGIRFFYREFIRALLFTSQFFLPVGVTSGYDAMVGGDGGTSSPSYYSRRTVSTTIISLFGMQKRRPQFIILSRA